ncbi:hypothetical protein [Lewinella sp. IMCC34183]|uniref:hypothetical protein n=1 Tax=Lewinella sp. IMCC34183 TaxID=2248762 RepID=UPI000E24C5C4|nr:hypothetical protein [Lewinella sp. IMCC34183]
MTLPDFLRSAAEHPTEVVFYFALIPFAALLAGWMEREEDHLPPWNYLYSALLYLVAVPATVAVGLLVVRYVEGGPAGDTDDLVLLAVPVASFFYTAYVIHRRVALSTLPGFGHLAGLVAMVALTLLLLWGVNRMGVVPVAALKVQYTVALFLLLLIVVRSLWRRAAT